MKYLINCSAGCVLEILSVDESAAVRVLFTTDHYRPLCKKRSTDLNIFTERNASIVLDKQTNQ